MEKKELKSEELEKVAGGSIAVPCPAGSPASGGSCGNDPAPGSNAEAASRALAEQGKPYQWGGVGPEGYDASGLVSYALTGTHMRIGTTDTFMSWPRVSSPEPGDVCVNSGHCGIYIGGGKMVHAPTFGQAVCVSGVESSMIFVRYAG